MSYGVDSGGTALTQTSVVTSIASIVQVDFETVHAMRAAIAAFETRVFAFDIPSEETRSTKLVM